MSGEKSKIQKSVYVCAGEYGVDGKFHEFVYKCMAYDVRTLQAPSVTQPLHQIYTRAKWVCKFVCLCRVFFFAFRSIPFRSLLAILF